jgi:double-strand break repair protein MRE11
MSDSEDDAPMQHHDEEVEGDNIILQNDDPDTLRILLSTDNHLGYAERDPIRGMDSFAAFEEVLYLARRFHCDMVLIAGDLFHENRPSRRTLYKTMEILRRYCMGPDPVPIQILSTTDNSKTLRSSVAGVANYLDPNYAVHLPVFSIHGNHDDPSRDQGGGELLAPLGTLSFVGGGVLHVCATNTASSLFCWKQIYWPFPTWYVSLPSLFFLDTEVHWIHVVVSSFSQIQVNYFGRQDEVDQIEIAPILLQKGHTKVALYGLGSLRDERLNRMWERQKVRFLRPEEEDEDDEEGFFNIFALHQNRDLGRGAKNCVQEAMIPEWMDVVMWVRELCVFTHCIVRPSFSLSLISSL